MNFLLEFGLWAASKTLFKIYEKGYYALVELCLNIGDSDLVWRMQLMIIKGYKFVLRVKGEPLMLINWIFIPNLSRIYFLYKKSFKRTFKTGFEYKITFWIDFLVLLIHKGYCIVKKLVWNVHIKISGIQTYLYLIIRF